MEQGFSYVPLGLEFRGHSKFNGDIELSSLEYI